MSLVPPEAQDDYLLLFGVLRGWQAIDIPRHYGHTDVDSASLVVFSPIVHGMFYDGIGGLMADGVR